MMGGRGRGGVCERDNVDLLVGREGGREGLGRG